MNTLRSILWGIFLVAIGVLIALESFISIDIFFDGWWTLFIIVPSIIGLITDDDKTGSIVWIVIGILLLITCQGKMTFEQLWSLLIPAILIIIGLSLIFKNLLHKKINDKIIELNKEKNDLILTSTFSSINENYDDKEFEGIELNSFFGSIVLDLRKAKIKKDVIINVNAIFGGIDIKVPKNANVFISSNSVFGGFENKTKNDEENKINIYVKGSCVFGGVEIK